MFFFFEMNKRSDIVVYPLGNGLHYSGRSGGYFQERLIYFFTDPVALSCGIFKDVSQWTTWRVRPSESSCGART